eukprot:gb/GECH01007252.1/.p1 GENE.gb/GECH01007252.1/~~gb/GECH01007252.1/.p1  ORF type:complete len:772 (+),score=158.58 gb/GECH01007252.1/:1-2316(+)
MTLNNNTNNNDSVPSKNDIDLYQQLSSIPQTAGAQFTDKDGNIFMQFQHRDVHANKTRNSFKSLINCDGKYISSSFPLISGDDIKLVSLSPCHTRMCIVRQIEGKKTSGATVRVESWTHAGLESSMNADGKHGVIATDPEHLGGVCWHPSGTRIVYAAHVPHSLSSSEKNHQNDKSDSQDRSNKSVFEGGSGDHHLYESTTEYAWGEGYPNDGVSYRAFICDFTRKEIQNVSCHISEDLVIGQPQFVPLEKGNNAQQEDAIVFVGIDLKDMTRPLGLRYCFQRPSALYYTKIKQDTNEEKKEREEEGKESLCQKLTDQEDWAPRCPRFSPDGSMLVYLAPGKESVHASCVKLVSISWPSVKRRVIVDQIHQVNTSNDHFQEFPGLFVLSLPSSTKCWSTHQPGTLFLETRWRGSVAIAAVDIEQGSVCRIENPPVHNDQHYIGSLLFRDSICSKEGDQLLLQYSTPTIPGDLYIYHTKNKKWLQIFDSVANLDSNIQKLLNEKINWNLMDVPVDPVQEDGSDKTVECIYVSPKDVDQPPLILNPHGGPQSVFNTLFGLSVTYFALLGFAVCRVNYHGSIGYGQAFCKSLPGRIGELDVKDCHACVKFLEHQNAIDSSKVAAWGGSHGGFLSCHLVGQYPDIYSAAIVRNPVTDVASNYFVSDISDWCLSESGYDPYATDVVNAQMYTHMFQSSPMQHVSNIKAPVAIFLGQNDLRCPPTQGKNFYFALKNLGVSTKLKVYEGNGHSIITPGCEGDYFITAATWLKHHVLNK